MRTIGGAAGFQLLVFSSPSYKSRSRSSVLYLLPLLNTTFSIDRHHHQSFLSYLLQQSSSRAILMASVLLHLLSLSIFVITTTTMVSFPPSQSRLAPFRTFPPRPSTLQTHQHHHHHHPPGKSCFFSASLPKTSNLAIPPYLTPSKVHANRSIPHPARFLLLPQSQAAKPPTLQRSPLVVAKFSRLTPRPSPISSQRSVPGPLATERQDLLLSARPPYLAP